MQLFNGISIYSQTIADVNTAVLDGFPAAQLACSISAILRSSWLGDLIVVRRDTDNLELSIGRNSNNELDQVALLAHCGAGNGYVVKIWDQEGNNNHLIQSVQNLQPRIVTAGVVELLNGKPCAISTTVAPQGNLTATVAGGINSTFFAVCGSDPAVWSVFLQGQSGSEYFGEGKSGSTTANGYNNAGAPSHYSNGTLVATLTLGNIYNSTQPQGVVSVTDLDLSTWTAINTDYTGSTAISPLTHFQTMILYNTNQNSNRADIELRLNQYYKVY